MPPGEPGTIHAVESWLAHDAAEVLASSKFLVREVIEGFELAAECTHLIPNGIDPTWWSTGESPGGRTPLVFTWGRVQYEKGFQVLARAMRLLRSRVPGIECVIGGRGSYLPELQSQIDLEGVSDLVHLPGFIPDDRLRDTVHRAGCVVIPSLYEPFGIVALEALAGGAPLVVARTGGLAELIEDTGAGLMFEPGNHAELAGCVETVLTRPRPRRRDAPARRRPARRALLVVGDRRRHRQRLRRTPVRTLTSRRSPATQAVAGRSFAGAQSLAVPAEGSQFVTTIRPMRPVRRFEVTPAIPPALAALPDIASNLHWSWDPEATRLFARLWPGWRPGPAHPAEMVRTTPAERLAELAADPGIVNDVGAVSRRLQTALKGTTWFGSREDSPLHLVAYFSPEFGISEALPQYSGGLGVLAGDHLKASSDLGVPLVGIGLLYTEGYFRQRLDADGWQQESVADFTPQSLGLIDTGVEVTVDLAGDPVRCHVWRADVGRIPLYLLDTDVEGNSPDGVAVTDRLYGGDEHHRLRQEIVLGIGGRAGAARPRPGAGGVPHQRGPRRLPRPRAHPRAGRRRDCRSPRPSRPSRGGGVFTTHTPVPAGIDRFPRALIATYFADFAKECGVTFDELFDLGRRADEPDDKFNMAVMGLRLAARSNGVARLHGAVSREMFNGHVARPRRRRGADRLDHQRRARSHVGVGHASTPCSPASSARTGPAPTPTRGRGSRDVDRARSVGGAQRRPRRARPPRPPAPRRGRPRPDGADDRLRPPLRHLQAGDAAAVGPERLLRAAARSATGRCSSCSPARPTRPTRRARS